MRHFVEPEVSRNVTSRPWAHRGDRRMPTLIRALDSGGYGIWVAYWVAYEALARRMNGAGSFNPE